MQLPNLTRKGSMDTVNMISQFAGLNMNERINEAECFDMKNLTTDMFPVLATRKKRGIIKTLEKPQGIIGGRYLGYVDNDKLYYDDIYVCDLEEGGERKLVMMGAYLCVFPDGVVYNTYDRSLLTIENEVTTTTHPTVTLCKIDGTNFTSDNCITSDTEPTDKKKYWLDTSQDTVVLKMYSDSYSMWVSVGTTYCKFEAPGIGVGFKDYDAADFSGVDTDKTYNNWDFNQSNLIYKAGEDYLIVAGLIDKVFTNSRNITVKRKMPKMDFVCESGNRLFGCSSENHEIYASKLGDPTNWYSYAGLDSDSYAATVGTQNVFTACVAYSGYVFFFKEDGYHKMYGNKPSNFEIVWKPGRGVQQGSDKSVCVVNDTLFFKARDAVCVYDGSCVSISDKLGFNNYYDAVAGNYRTKYYVSMRDDAYNYYLYVYDLSKGTWTKEDKKHVYFMAYGNNGLFMIDYDRNLEVVNNEAIRKRRFPSKTLYPSKALYPGYSDDGTLEEQVEWFFESGDIGLDSPYEKYIKRLNIRLHLDARAKVKIEIMYDSSGSWKHLIEYFATNTRSIELPVTIERCDHLRLKFTGAGDFKLYSISKVIEGGTGLNGEL